MTRRHVQPLAATAALVALVIALGAPAPSAAQVNVSGTGNAGVNLMYGGVIQVGLNDAQIRALLQAQGKAQETLLRQIAIEQAASYNLQVQRAAFTEGAVQQFLSILVQRQVPQGQWPQVLGGIARRYLELEGRMGTIPATTDKVKAVIRQADAARVAGRFDDAEALLAQCTEIALEEARNSKARALAASRQAAAVLASQASLALVRQDRDKAARLLIQAADQRADDPAPETFNWLIDAGEARVAAGHLQLALETFTRARDVAQARLAATPNDPTWLRGLSSAHARIGDVLGQQGHLTGELRNFQASRDIALRLAGRLPGNVQLQRDLAVSHSKLGEAYFDQGIFAEALRSYQADLAITRPLADRAPDNAQWQRDLSVSHAGIGRVLLASGDLAGALRSFQAGLAIAQKLAARDPDNAEWQRDLALSHATIGRVLSKQGLHADALRSQQTRLAIQQKLTARDPGNTEWQYGLSVSHDDVGDLLSTAGQLAEALPHHRASLAIRQRLVGLDPANIDWQTGVAVSCWKLGHYAPMLPRTERQALLQRGLAVVEQLDQQGRLRVREQTLPELFRRALQKPD